jgi:hypothetical protein
LNYSQGLTLAITWPQSAPSGEDSIAVAAQVYGDVRLLELSIMEVFKGTQQLIGYRLGFFGQEQGMSSL